MTESQNGRTESRPATGEQFSRELVIEALRAQVAGLDGPAAAAGCELLITSGWLDRKDFPRYIEIHVPLSRTPGVGILDGPPLLAVVGWARVLTDLHFGRLAAEDRDAAMLRLIASFYGRTTVDLAEVLAPLSTEQVMTVTAAVMAVKEPTWRVLIARRPGTGETS